MAEGTAESAGLVEFLLARIAEDEASGHWYQLTPPSPGGVGRAAIYREGRVLAECEAKRRIVAGFTPDCDPGCVHPPFDPHWVVKDLAAVYAAHPDYRQEWRP